MFKYTVMEKFESDLRWIEQFHIIHIISNSLHCTYLPLNFENSQIPLFQQRATCRKGSYLFCTLSKVLQLKADHESLLNIG